MITLAYVTGYAVGWGSSLWEPTEPTGWLADLLAHYTRSEREDYNSGFLMGARLRMEADGVVIHAEARA